MDFRLVCATNQNLETLVKSGGFREDLFFRIGVLKIALPPLRGRAEDIPELISALLPRRKMSEELASSLRSYSWPGNVRELRNILQALDVLASEGEELLLEHLPENALRSFSIEAVKDAPPDDLLGFVNEQENREKEFLSRAYRSAKGNVSAMARVLRLDRSHLHQKLVRLGIHETRR